ncbi:hypothetical protein [Vallitalea sp.]|jgi:predicted transcriptional regulator|uniref:hypothetical protein n=1 Tax=Vallitalea sp. TaxID=1882829 RepID=UPI0025D20A9B|nr:hypothetical protein [Vallitalea sp.]MCT4687305.1 hypothetical protein [Vallitalea sp.]
MVDIKKFRQEVGLTLFELSKESSVAVTKILLHEQGIIEMNLLDQDKVRKALELSIEEFFEGGQIEQKQLTEEERLEEEIRVLTIEYMRALKDIQKNPNHESWYNLGEMKKEIDDLEKKFMGMS